MVIEQINNMKQQGMQTNQIIQNLKQQGVSPKEINEALSQSEIKSEINNNQNVFPTSPESNMQPSDAAQPATPAAPQQTTQPAAEQSVQQTPSNTQMQPSIGQQMQQQPMQQAPMDNQSMQMPMAPQSTQPVALQPQTQDFSQYQEYAPEDEYNYDYPEYQGGGGGGADIETINDISSQLIDEKTKHFKKEFSEFTNFKKESHSKLENLDKRLTKLEDTIEDLKMAIIRKIGEYGDDIKHLSKEMKATQDAFAKVVEPLTGQAKQVQASQPKKESTATKAPKSKGSDSFEDYLR